MKSRLLLICFCFNLFIVSAQTNGWYQLMGVSSISTVQVIDTSSESVLIGTNIGLIKYNTSTQQIIDYANLTSQIKAVGNVRGISQNPTNNEVALETGNGFAIYDGTSVMPYNYENSELTIGESSYQPLKTYYGIGGELYLYKTDVQAYQIFDNGVFEAEVAINFTPTALMENALGTKLYLGSTNQGVFEYDKGNDTFTNYTTSNSDLLSNTVGKLYRDHNDFMYVGFGSYGYVGFNRFDQSNNWETFQELVPSTSYYYPALDFDVSPISNMVLVNSSAAGVPNGLGFFTVDTTTNSWTHYTNDNTNCLNYNTFSDICYGLNDKIYASKYSTSSELVEFTPSTSICNPIDLNYLNIPRIDFSSTKSFDIREKSNGNFEIGYTDYFHLNMFEIDPSSFNGNINNSFMSLDAPMGELYTDLYADNDMFIIDKRSGLGFVDAMNTITNFDYNNTNFSSIKTKKATLKNSDDNILNFVNYGFVNGEYRVYKTQCDTGLKTCSDLEEILTTNRNVALPISFGVFEDPENREVTCTSIQTNNNTGSDILIETSESWNGGDNGDPNAQYAALVLTALLNFDPEHSASLLEGEIIRQPVGINYKSETELQILTPTDNPNNQPVVTNEIFDTNTDGINDKILHINNSILTGVANDLTQTYLILGLNNSVSGSSTINEFVIKAINFVTEPSNFNTSSTLVNVPGAALSGIPNDFTVYDASIKQYGTNEAIIILLTNYGILIKTAINISGLILSVNTVSLNENSIRLFPNPANDLVSFSDKSIKSIEIYDLNNRKILGSEGYSIDVKSLKNGVYLIKGTTLDNKVVLKKLVKN